MRVVMREPFVATRGFVSCGTIAICGSQFARCWADAHCSASDVDRHTATHCNTLQHTATHCNTLQHFVGPMHIPQPQMWIGTLRHTAKLQHTATHCNTTTHGNTLLGRYPFAYILWLYAHSSLYFPPHSSLYLSLHCALMYSVAPILLYCRECYLQKSPVYPQKSPVYLQKSPIYLKKPMHMRGYLSRYILHRAIDYET